MSYLPLLLSLASFGRHTPMRASDRRGGPSGKVGTLPGAYTSPTWRPGDTTRCVCPVCDPDDEPGGDDPDSFWREQTSEERAAISAAYVKEYGDFPYGDQSHARSTP